MVERSSIENIGKIFGLITRKLLRLFMKKEINIQQEKEIIYPRFLSTAPCGVDLFEGKSQETIKTSIEQYVLNTDNPVKQISEKEMPRIIGLEGKWGMGKSNVIKMLETESALKDNYIFFMYDAWGNQEDLQRKTVLFQLTKQLINREQLVKMTHVLHYNPQKDEEPYEKECSWEERLQSLVTNKSYTREISVPSIRTSTKLFGLMLVVTGLLISLLQLFDLYWVWDVSISLLPLIVFSFYMIKESKEDYCKGWRDMFAMYETAGRTDTTAFVISQQEPSVGEFKSWMQDISDSLAEGKKLVIVFDNMDRLSSNKVRTLWSSIHTFFADSNNKYDKIWCIIPYDAEHLSNAFEGDTQNEKTDLLKRFLQKTFPIIFHVPEPIITDYKEVVRELMRRAFGDKLTEEEIDTINRCYRLTYTTPNVREIIAFINELVQLYHTWQTKIDTLSMAIYILKKKHIENPIVKINNKEVGQSSEEYILLKSYETSYRYVLDYEKSDELQRNIAALHYGVLPEKAYQIMLKRALTDILNEQRSAKTISHYMVSDEQLSILEEAVFELDPQRFENAAKYFVIAEKENISSKAQKKLQKFWNHLADEFLKNFEAMPTFTEYLHNLLEHISEERQKKCVWQFTWRLYRTESSGGASVYKQLSALFSKSYAQNWDAQKVCSNYTFTPEEFLNYVHAAGTEYSKYPISVNENKMNDYLISLLQKQFTYVEEIRLLKDSYDLTPFVEKVIETISAGQANAIIVAPLLKVLQLYYDKFPIPNLSASYVDQLWGGIQADPKLASYSEIYALKAFVSMNANMPNALENMQVLRERMLFYTSTASLLKKCLELRFDYLVGLATIIITEKIHDSIPFNSEWVHEWQLLADVCRVDRSVVVSFAADWGYQISEKEKSTSIKTLLPQHEWIDALLKEPKTQLADELLKKFASELEKCSLPDFLANGIAAHANSYWDRVLTRLIDTDYIPNTEQGVLKLLAVELIHFAARNNKIEDSTWLKVISKCNYRAISAEIATIRGKILSNQDGYAISPNNFDLLHLYLEKAGVNKVDYRTDAANFVLAKVIDNADCQRIIMQSDYYKPIIEDTKDTASVLHEKIKNIEIANPESEFSNYLRGIVDYVPKKQANDNAEDGEKSGLDESEKK